jgi:hypothetical protein
LAISANKQQLTMLKKHRLLNISVYAFIEPALFPWLIVALVQNGHCQGGLDVVAVGWWCVDIKM